VKESGFAAFLAGVLLAFGIGGAATAPKAGARQEGQRLAGYWTRVGDYIRVAQTKEREQHPKAA